MGTRRSTLARNTRVYGNVVRGVRAAPSRTSRRVVVVVVVVYGRRARVGIARIARSRTTPRVVVVVVGGIIGGIIIIIIIIGAEKVRKATSRDGDGGVAVQGAR